MYNNKKISLYVPCRNESKNLETLAKRIPSFIDEVIIVSNKSTDDTYEKALSLGFKAFKDDRTIDGIGYGFAHLTGIAKATGDIVISADGDAEHPIEELDQILSDFEARGLDFMTCSRYPLKKGVKLPFKRWLGVFILNLEVKVLYGIDLNDVLSGMWIFKKGVNHLLNLQMGEWNLSPEIKIRAATNKNINYGEYNIAQHKRAAGVSKQQYFKTGMQHLMWIFVNRFKSNIFKNVRLQYNLG
jgi:glycosyltransferase involved in cell wall biosynthesis